MALFGFGCSAGNSLVNNNIPPVDNLLGVNDKSVIATVNGSRATISGNANGSVTFDDRSLPQKNLLHFVKFTQGIDDNLQVTVPASATLPDSFQLRNITLALTVSDGAGSSLRTASAQGTVAGPITYVHVTGTDQYTAANNHLSFSDIEISGSSFSAFRDIVTSAPSPNTATARLSFDTDDQSLPNGSTISFTFRSGQARVGI
jgi:hypothetical protein